MELPNRATLDAEAAALLMQLSERQRVDLRRLLGNPPLWENIPPQWWARAQRELEEEAAAVLLLVYVASGEFHGWGADDAQRAGRSWANQRSVATARQFVETTQERLRQSTDDWLRRMLTDGQQIDQSEIDDRLTQLLGPDRAQRLAEDLVTQGQTAGGEDAMRTLGAITDLDTWYTVSDGRVCSVCAPLHGEPRTVWQDEMPAGPPAHPSCRCWIDYQTTLNVGL